jgi:hypothetical protein
MQQLIPPFNREIAMAKVRMAENAWNSRDPDRVSMAYADNLHHQRRRHGQPNRIAVFEQSEAVSGSLGGIDRKFDQKVVVAGGRVKDGLGGRVK